MQAAWKERVAELGEAIKADPIYKNWVQARTDLEERHAARVMLRDVQRAQAELMAKMQQGESVTEEEQTRWQRTVETAAYNPYVAAVLQAEAALGQLLTEVNESLMRQIGLAQEDEEGDFSDGNVQLPTADGATSGEGPSRLWVPGR